ncbi:MAG TPA: toll/interleukin-1 receptor domain-containing protein [Longimicrobiaceae bacterium]
MERDLFISYASEERETVARPLAELLSGLGVNVWFDQFDLKIGDSLRQKIDQGLAGCRYGVVVLSKSFFSRHHPVRELDGLAQREVDGNRILLPIWVDVTDRDVRTFSPPLADRIAAKWEEGLYSVATKILEVVRPEILEKIQSETKYLPLARIHSGRELARIIGGAHFSYQHNDEPQDEVEVDLVGGFLQEIRDWSDIWDDIEPSEHVRTEFRLSRLIQDLESAGWTVYAERRSGRRKIGGVVDDWIWSVVALVRGEAEQVLHVDNKVIVLRKPAPSP